MEANASTYDPAKVVWCEAHKAFTSRDCLGPDCVAKESQLEQVEEE